MKDSLLLNALHQKNYDRPPVWLMRQAGRYMPKYQALRKNRSLFDLFHDVEKIVEITLLPVHDLGVDAAILFSDILTICDGLNVRWGFDDGKGPILPDKIQPGLSFRIHENAYSHISKSISLLKKELKVPLLGFAGCPFTIASYMIEGGTSKDLKRTKQWLYEDPFSFHELLDQITVETIRYLQIQVNAGVDAIQLFDSWANHLDHPSFIEFSLHYMKRIKEAVSVPVIVFCRGSCQHAEDLSSIEPAAIALDWTGDVAKIRKKIPNIALQGNLDPMALFASPEQIKKKVDLLLGGMAGDPGYIFNLGHGVLPGTPYEHVKMLVDHVKGFLISK